MKSNCMDNEIMALEEAIEKTWSDWPDSKKSLYIIMMTSFTNECVALSAAWETANTAYNPDYSGLFCKTLREISIKIVNVIRKDTYDNLAVASCKWDCSIDQMINFGKIHRHGFHLENDQWRLAMLKFQSTLIEKINNSYKYPHCIGPLGIYY